MRAFLSLLIVAAAFALVCQTSEASEAQAPDARIEEARQAIGRREFTRAVGILSEATQQNPSADAYLYLGIAYANMREFTRAEDTLRDGARRYPADPRFRNELAGTFLARREPERARAALKEALEVDPTNEYALDLLANIDMSEGKVRTALDFWNRQDRPIVNEVLHNRYPGFGHWTIPEAMAFEPGEPLRYTDWRTTESRLFATKLYGNVGVEIEPTARSGYYNVDIRTTSRKTTRESVLFGLAVGLPVQTSYLDLWNIRGSGVSLLSQYRWEAQRRLVDVTAHAPIPLPGILFSDSSGIWRSELWDVSSQAIQPSPADSFIYKSTGGRVMFRHIPSYRLELAGGWEYRNRAASGTLPGLELNSLNSSTAIAETTIVLWDRDKTRSHLHAEGFLARKVFFGDLDYSGGVVEWGARWSRQRANRQTSLVSVLSGGMSSGDLPIDEYFVLGVQTHPRFLLRAHSVTHDGVSGFSPLGTAFVLSNTTLEREIVKIPTFNAANLPLITVKGELFMDVAKAFDRAGLFREDRIFVDLGLGLQFATPTHALHLAFGQSATDGRRAFTAYVEKTW
ncbi:MAG TPA: tetratricopeptide repeat protein [Terriglobia bacterium]|nr:tetratricopeptide repeat protein [Terriglobia bacterium]